MEKKINIRKALRNKFFKKNLISNFCNLVFPLFFWANKIYNLHFFCCISKSNPKKEKLVIQYCFYDLQFSSTLKVYRISSPSSSSSSSWSRYLFLFVLKMRETQKLNFVTPQNFLLTNVFIFFKVCYFSSLKNFNYTCFFSSNFNSF